MALVLLVAAFGLTYWAGRRSLGWGVTVLLMWGYLFGIVRANLLSVSCYFLFDVALLGLYLAQRSAFTDPADARRTATLRIWIAALIVWPLLLVLMPFQPFLVSLVGLRGSVFFLPMALLGSRLKESDLTVVCNGLACCNLLALGFALAEYFLGLERFYPWNSVTNLIYISHDVSGGYYRIPGIFSSAHAYGGTMVCSMPYLVGAWSRGLTKRAGLIAIAGIAAALAGILMSATRLNFILGSAMVLVIILGGRIKTSRRILFIILIVGMAGIALNNERFQRFKSLGDTEFVEDRVSGSVNRGFFEILFEYPLGNGLGGGGTSMPYFLEGQVHNPIGMENEYARILCEQGIIGLIMWLSFLGWFIGRAGQVFAKGPWATGRRLVWALALLIFATGAIGLGVLNAIPGTAMLLLGIGWTSTLMQAGQEPARRPYAAASRGPRAVSPLVRLPVSSGRPVL